MRIAVIILAAGQGRRMGAEVNKMFLPLAGEAVLLHSVRLFQAEADVAQIVVAAAPGEVRQVKELLREADLLHGVTVAEGGSTRLRSVAAALPHISCQADLVAIHDGARPLLSAADFRAVAAAAAAPGYAGAILAAPVTDTIKTAAALPETAGPGQLVGSIAGSLQRELLWRALTPQVFAIEPLLEAYSTLDKDFTDDAALLAAAGKTVALVWGSEENIKITTPLDLRLAELILQEREAK